MLLLNSATFIHRDIHQRNLQSTDPIHLLRNQNINPIRLQRIHTDQQIRVERRQNRSVNIGSPYLRTPLNFAQVLLVIVPVMPWARRTFVGSVGQRRTLTQRSSTQDVSMPVSTQMFTVRSCTPLEMRASINAYIAFRSRLFNYWGRFDMPVKFTAVRERICNSVDEEEEEPF